MPERVDLSVRPTPDQERRFRALSMSERYAWLASMLQTMHSLATDETRAQWRAMKEAQSGGFLSVAHAFARALGRAVFDEAARCLSPAIRYESSDGTMSGVERIVASYRDNHRWFLQHIDRVHQRSHVEALAPGVARITFEDRLEHRGLSHVYRCVDEVSVGRSKFIECIVHSEIDGEREALEEFFVRAKIESNPSFARGSLVTPRVAP